MRKSEPSTGSRLLRAGIATAATAAVVAGAATPAFAAPVPVVLSSTAGPTAGGNTITASSTTTQAFLTGVTTPHTTFSIPACQQTYNTAAATAATPSSTTVGNVLAPGAAKKITNSKASITIPALPIAVPATTSSTRYNVCIFASSSAGAALVGTTTYTVAAAPVYPSSGVITPASGPSLGGTRITVNATSGLPTTPGSITATLGGVPLTNITPVSATAFTATTPARTPGPASLVVTTAAGPKTIANAFTYANGIMIEPNTAPRTSTATIVDVMGAGFSGYTFGSSATNARVWLVDGQYEPGTSTSGTGGVPATAYTTGPSAECTGVVVISDNELLCTLNLLAGGLVPTTGAAATGSAANVPNGTYTLTVVSNGDIAAGDDDDYAVTDISSGSTFTVAPY